MDDDGDIEFLDPGSAEDEIDWLGESDGEDRVEGGGDPRRLPPHAHRGRLLASVLSLALVLGALGAAGTTAYHRHETDLRVANTLDVSAASAAPSIPGLAQLAFSTVWHAHPSETVTVPVVNKGPDIITLIGGELTEPGLSAVADFKPLGTATIAPGRSGTLVGTVTADCTTELDNGMLSSAYGSSLRIRRYTAAPGGQGVGTATAIVGDGSGPVSLSDLAPGTLPQAARAKLGSLRVRARSVGGRIGVRTIYPENALGTIAVRICSQQGDNVVSASDLRTSADPATHTITVSLPATSIADVALRYHADAAFSTQPEAPGLELPQVLTATSPDTGSVRPGGAVTLSFAVHIARCSSSNIPPGENILLTALFLLDNRLVSFQSYTADVQPLIAKACGLG